MIPPHCLTVVLVNWNAGSQLASAVSSIAEYAGSTVAKVVVVDNNSSDNSLQLVMDLGTLPFRLEVIRNASNRGFGAACNQGAQQADSALLLFLNPDTRLFSGSLLPPLELLASDAGKSTAIVGIQLIDEQGRISRSCARFPTVWRFLAQSIGVSRLPGLRHLGVRMDDWEHDRDRQVDHVIGAFYMTRTSVFRALAGFDERFFVYLEDLDFSLRASNHGWSSVYLASAQAFHAGGGTSRQVKDRRLFYSLHSRILFASKHLSPWSASAVALSTLILEPLIRSIPLLLRGAIVDVRNTISAYGMLYRRILRRTRE